MAFKSQGRSWAEVNKALANAPELASGKGIEGQNCNVTSCQKENSAHHYNTVMKAWYCKSCAQKIEYWANVDGMSFFEGIEGRR